MRRAGQAVIIGSLISSTVAAAQIPAPARLTITFSGIHNAPIETREGPRNDRTYAALNLRAIWPLQHRRVAIEYTADLVSLALATANRTYHWQGAQCGGGDCDGSLHRFAARYATAGIGVSPVGLQVRFPLRFGLSLTGGASAGALYFLRPIPDHEAARFNFVADVGATLDLAVKRRRELSVGYRFQHISNAGTAPVNVGLNTHLVVLGWTVRR
jgi:hypothetical protein